MTAAENILAKQMRVGTFITNFLRNTAKATSGLDELAYLKNRVGILERYWVDFRERDMDLEGYRKELEKDEYYIQDHYSIIEVRYGQAMAALNTQIESLEPTPPVVIPQNQENTNFRSNAGASEFHAMPKLHIPKFTGKREEWQTFKQQFTSMVRNKHMSNDLKMQYLADSIEGRAARRLGTLELTGENFELAWKKLVARYDNIHIRLATKLDELINLSAVKNRVAEEYSDLIDTADIAITGLKQLGCPVEHWDNWLVHCVVRKLDYSTRKDWEISHEGKD